MAFALDSPGEADQNGPLFDHPCHLTLGAGSATILCVRDRRRQNMNLRTYIDFASKIRQAERLEPSAGCTRPCIAGCEAHGSHGARE